MRRVLAALIVVGLVIGVIVFWPRSDPDDPSGTIAGASTTTTATVASTTTTPPSTSSSSTTGDGHVVETVAEAEAILRELWFGWFEGIYTEDEDRIREVVVLEETVDTARESFGSSFPTPPTPGDITFSNTELLRSDTKCLAVWTEMTLEGFREGTSGSVHVLRIVDGQWQRLSLWRFKDDLWEPDCDSQLPSS